MRSETGTQTVSINILSDISKSKFGQLIEYNLRNVFLINHAQLKKFFWKVKVLRFVVQIYSGFSFVIYPVSFAKTIITKWQF